MAMLVPMAMPAREVQHHRPAPNGAERASIRAGRASVRVPVVVLVAFSTIGQR